MRTFQKGVFWLGLFLWAGTAVAQGESLDELLEGFGDSPSSQQESVDDLLDGFLESLTPTTHQPHQLQVCGNHVHTMIHDAEDYLRTHLDRPR